jgi:hypothetical protein
MVLFHNSAFFAISFFAFLCFFGVLTINWWSIAKPNLYENRNPQKQPHHHTTTPPTASNYFVALLWDYFLRCWYTRIQDKPTNTLKRSYFTQNKVGGLFTIGKGTGGGGGYHGELFLLFLGKISLFRM